MRRRYDKLHMALQWTNMKGLMFGQELFDASQKEQEIDGSDERSQVVFTYSSWHLALARFQKAYSHCRCQGSSPQFFEREFTLFDIWSQLDVDFQVEKS